MWTATAITLWESYTFKLKWEEADFPILYSFLSFNKELTIDRLETWKLDVQEDIHEAKWEMAWLNAQKQSINTRMKCYSTSS